jgi:hypothetical protein
MGTDMTSDAARKRQARALARESGIPYSEAARRLAAVAAATSPRCIDLTDALRAGLAATGVTAVVDGPQFGAYKLYAGPATITISREASTWSGAGDDDPDDELHYDLAAPPDITGMIPLLDEGTAQDFTIAPGSAETMAQQFHDGLGAARERAARRAVDDASCAICGDAYPAGQLVQLGFHDPVVVCPACPFDGDLIRDLYPEQTAWALQELLYHDPAAPARWAGVIALLACGGPSHAVPARWAETLDTPSEPEPYWSDPARIWVWLPPRPARPDWLRDAGAGLDLGALVTRAAEFFPHATASLAAELDAELAMDDGDDLERDRAAEVLQPGLWPALVAYAVSFATQIAERPGHREPWHVTESFEEGRLRQVLTELGSRYDPYGAEMTMRDVERLATLLGLRRDADPARAS